MIQVVVGSFSLGSGGPESLRRPEVSQLPVEAVQREHPLLASSYSLYLSGLIMISYHNIDHAISQAQDGRSLVSLDNGRWMGLIQAWIPGPLPTIIRQ